MTSDGSLAWCGLLPECLMAEKKKKKKGFPQGGCLRVTEVPNRVVTQTPFRISVLHWDAAKALQNYGTEWSIIGHLLACTD